MLRKALVEKAWGGDGAMYADHSCQLLPLLPASLKECQLPSDRQLPDVAIYPYCLQLLLSAPFFFLKVSL